MILVLWSIDPLSGILWSKSCLYGCHKYCIDITREDFRLNIGIQTMICIFIPWNLWSFFYCHCVQFRCEYVYSYGLKISVAYLQSCRTHICINMSYHFSELLNAIVSGHFKTNSTGQINNSLLYAYAAKILCTFLFWDQIIPNILAFSLLTQWF